MIIATKKGIIGNKEGIKELKKIKNQTLNEFLENLK